MATISTKRIARLTGATTATVNELVRDLGIGREYRADLRSWYIATADARMLVGMLAAA